MRPLTAILCVLVALAAAFCIFFYVGGTLTAQVNCVTAAASEYPEAFASIREDIQSGRVERLYRNEDMTDAGQYTLVDVTVQLANRGVVDAEWISAEPAQLEGDIALYSIGGIGSDVPAGGMQTLNLKLVTREPADAPRSLAVEYYVYGIKRRINVKY